MISTIITAMELGDVALNDIKGYAWRSFAQIIDISSIK